MKMKQKILNNMVYIAVVAVLITTTLIGMFTYYRYMEQIKTGMKDEAAYLAASLNFEDQQNLDKYKNITITRITRIAKDGTVIYDSSGKEKSMGNHKNRTEVKEAFKHGHGEDTRMSMTLRKQTYYYALKLKDGTILRMSPDDRKTDGRYHSDHRLDSCSCNDIICDIIKNVDRSYRRTDQPDKFDTSKTEQNI